jgi:S-adenosylmethionine decarboxylase proenzyme
VKAGGVQVLADLFNCDPRLLNDRAVIDTALSTAAHAAGVTVVKQDVHAFDPHGFTGIAILAESHLAIHTWPEHAYATVDIFTCGETARPDQAIDAVANILGARTVTRCSLNRGEGVLAPLAEDTRP